MANELTATVVDGQWTVEEARYRGEMLHATARRAEIPAYLLESSETGWLNMLRPITITIALTPGHGSEEHLFDRTIQRVADAIEGRMFLSRQDAGKAAFIRHPESLQYAVEVEVAPHWRALPADRTSEAEEIREPLRRRERIQSHRVARKRLAECIPVRSEEGHWVLSTERRARDGKWITTIGGTRYWWLPGWSQSGNHLPASGIAVPCAHFANEADARNARARWLNEFDEAIARL